MKGRWIPRSVPNEFRNLLDAAPDAAIMVDRRGRMTALNVEAERVFGWSASDLVGQPMARVIPIRFQLLVEPHPEMGEAGTSRTAGAETFSCLASRRDGTAVPVDVSQRTLGCGRSAQSLVTFRNHTELSLVEAPSPRRNARARAIIESIGDAVVTTGVDRLITYLNPVAERLTGWTVDEARGQSLDSVLPLISEVSRQPIENPVLRCLAEGRPIDLEDGVLLVRRDGTEVPIGDSTAPIRDGLGEVVGVVLIIQDESEKRRVGHQLSFEATHDALTGLLNQREFERRLVNVLATRSDARSAHFVLRLDLDRFKVVNDTCGHLAGDVLLRNISALFSGNLRKRDTLARVGGDEFGVILENCPPREAERIAESLREAVETHQFEWGDHTLTVGVSIGLLAVAEQGAAIADVLRAADEACYAAKEDGGGRVHVNARGRGTLDLPHARERRALLLARAADEGHFRLYAQPIVALQPDVSARPRIEILLRLPEAHGRMETAANFLPQAERYNLMPAIDRWVVRETIALLGAWRREHPHAELPVCSINLGPAALGDGRFPLIVERQLSLHDVPPDAICFEIAETAALADLGRAARFRVDLATIGCGMALDDFGSGVTSFTYLRDLPVDYLKIGGPFVQRIVDDPIYSSIVEAVDQIGKSIGIFTVAKHVSSHRVLDKVRALGVGYAQGHALMSPEPLTDHDGRVMLGELLQPV